MKKHLSRFARISFVITALALLVYLIAIRYTPVADLINSTVAVAVRFILSSLTYLLPFSFFECLIVISPLILVLVVWLLVRRASGRADMIRGVISFLAVICLIFTAYIFTLGIGYRTTYLSDRVGIADDSDISTEELYKTTLILIDGINQEVANLKFDNGETLMPYTEDEMSKKLIQAYDVMNEEYSLLANFPSRIKPVYFSTVMSDLGITGIYSFFTGEANVNVEYPDYYLPFTAAHELAHQRGISREDEANFVAFLVCIASDDAYIRYSAYLNMYEYVASALYRTDRDLYYKTVKLLPDVATADIDASYDVYVKHMDSPLGKINNKLNDMYLKANGTEGVVSYNYVVRLTVGYYQKTK
jgi:hypothetical protein